MFFKKLRLKLQLKQPEKSIEEYVDRPLDICDILSKEYSQDVIVDAYEYYMRIYDWEPINCEQSDLRDFLLTVCFDEEVQNGGTSQFLTNSTGDFFEETVTALKNIKAYEISERLEKVREMFPDKTVPADREKRNEMMESFDKSFDERLDELDNVVWSFDMSPLQYDFLTEHKEAFVKI